MDGSADTVTRDALAEGLIGLLKPAVEEVDERVRNVRQSQVELRQHIDGLAEGGFSSKSTPLYLDFAGNDWPAQQSQDLKKISENQQAPIELDSYVKKLNNSRRRVMLVNNILQNTQERLTKLHHNVSKETTRRKALLDPPSPGPSQ